MHKCAPNAQRGEMITRTHTYTYAVLEVDAATYDDIKRRLLAAGYEHAIGNDADHVETIDMHGIALQSSPPVGTPRARRKPQRLRRRAS
jgi:hypothetical protein